ncbi:MAG TPA: hypothetical protein VFB21_12020 [Chthonomonadaceae bacterium]|nr:hypothetical protein [Chthonomonadaceae bacterium]
MKRIGTLWSAAGMLMLVACLLLTPGAARAQLTADTEAAELTRDWNLRIGMFIPQMEAARNASSDVGVSGIVERTVYRTLNYELNVGIGYNGFDRLYSVPIMITGIGHHRGWRYGLGAGYAFGKRVSGRGTSGSVIGLVLGYQFTTGKNPLSADLRYNFVSGSDNELDGYSLTVGTQF